MLFKKASPDYQWNAQVELIRGGKGYFDHLEKLIQDARHFVFVQVYIFEDDGTGQRMARALAEAAQRKVKVYVLVDGYASQDLSKELIEDMTEKGVRVRGFEPLMKSKGYYFGRRLHHKVAVADGLSCLIGGINISDRYNDSPGKQAWMDWALRIDGPAAFTVLEICRKRLKLPVMTNPLNAPPLGEGYAVRIRVNDWVRRKKEITESYLGMLDNAVSEVIIMSPYFLPGREIRRAMRKSSARGVNIQVILAGNSDVMLSKYAERYIYRWLFRNNIKVYEYQKTVLHGKMAVCDSQWLTIGSYNVNNISAMASIELNADVAHEGLAKEATARLKEIMEQDCVRITEEDFVKKTGLWQMYLQRSAYDIIRILFFLFTFYFKQRE